MKDSLRENVAGLLPVITTFEKPFWDSLQEGKLLVQTCPKCGNKQFPPSPVCTHCLSDGVKWESYTGTAVLWSKVAFHKAYLEPYHDLPYNVALVSLTGDHILTARLPEEHKDLPLDSPVKLSIQKTADGTAVIVCEPA